MNIRFWEPTQIVIHGQMHVGQWVWDEQLPAEVSLVIATDTGRPVIWTMCRRMLSFALVASDKQPAGAGDIQGWSDDAQSTLILEVKHPPGETTAFLLEWEPAARVIRDAFGELPEDDLSERLLTAVDRWIEDMQRSGVL